MFVIDTSVAMCWCFEDEATEATDAILQRVAAEGCLVPSLWRMEVANVFLVAERRRRLTEAQSTRFLSLLNQLPIAVEVDVSTPSDLVALGRRHKLSAYDAAYLKLSETRGLALATLDKSLATAAGAAGVTLLLDPH